MQRYGTESVNVDILVIDDDEIYIDIICDMLSQLDVSNVAVANNGRKALSIFSRLERKPDYVIVDIYMPDMDGIEFLEKLAELEFHGGIIIVSGVNIETLGISLQLATASGLNVVAAMTKPIRKEHLAKALGKNSEAASCNQ